MLALGARLEIAVELRYKTKQGYYADLAIFSAASLKRSEVTRRTNILFMLADLIGAVLLFIYALSMVVAPPPRDPDAIH